VCFSFSSKLKKHSRSGPREWTLHAVICIFDPLNAATDPNWLGFHTETFIFAACIYFAISFGA